MFRRRMKPAGICLRPILSKEVAEKIIRHADALGGVSRFTFQMDSAELPHEKLMQSIALIGKRVMPLVNA